MHELLHGDVHWSIVAYKDISIPWAFIRTTAHFVSPGRHQLRQGRTIKSLDTGTLSQ